jgi:repressor LexA
VKPYTPRQREILAFIAGYQVDHGVSPTLEEIGDRFGVHRVTIFQHVNALERRGALRRSAQLARSIEILDPDFQPVRGLRVLGTIAAGRPIEAIEPGDGERVAAADVMPDDDDHFALRVRGDSMVEDAICDGDLVVCRRANQARNGQVVVAVVDGNDATLKRFYRDPDGRFRLVPANSAMQPIVVDRLEIRGIVTSVIRQL